METRYTICGMCGTRCPVAVGVEDDEAVWIQGNPHAPTGSALCPRGIAALALEKDPERPQSPLVRTGARGENTWRAVSWDEAFERIASGLRGVQAQYGPQSVVLSHRGGPFTDLYKAFANALGTPNIYNHGVTCTRNVEQACASVVGLKRDRLVIDYKESRHIVLQSRGCRNGHRLKRFDTVKSRSKRGWERKREAKRSAFSALISFPPPASKGRKDGNTLYHMRHVRHAMPGGGRRRGR